MWYVFNMPSKPKPSSTSKIRKLIEHKKLAIFSELERFGASGTLLKRMTESGQILALGSGIYASPKFDPFTATLYAASKYYPKAVISGLTALQIHGLSQEYIEKVDVDISRDTSLRNKMLNVHRVPNARLVGITELKYQGEVIRVYDIERTLCEAYLFDPAGALFFKALKRYVSLGKINTAAIQKYDASTKTAVLSHLRQELANE